MSTELRARDRVHDELRKVLRRCLHSKHRENSFRASTVTRSWVKLSEIEKREFDVVVTSDRLVSSSHLSSVPPSILDTSSSSGAVFSVPSSVHEGVAQCSDSMHGSVDDAIVTCSKQWFKHSAWFSHR